MDKKPRHAEVARMCAWWDTEVGDRPDNLESALGSFLKDMGVKAVWTALDLGARNEALIDSEDVLENVRSRIRRWRRANHRDSVARIAHAIAGRHGEETGR